MNEGNEELVKAHTGECPPIIDVTEYAFDHAEYFSFYGESGDVVFQLTPRGTVMVTRTVDPARHSGRKLMYVVTGAEVIVRTDFEAQEQQARVAALRETVMLDAPEGVRP